MSQLEDYKEDKCGSRGPHVTLHAVTQSTPSPVLSFVESASQGVHVIHVTEADSDKKFYCESSSSKVLQDVHISARLMEDFLELAKDNTDKDLETCGVLGAFLENGTFYVTTLIIPKQDSTSSSCQAVNEEEVFAIQNERSLLPVGWIHTHPSQSCFMSSIDLHTQYSYQVMVPEAFAIVVAPTDSSRSSGIFRLTDPGGMSVLKDCQENGFHPHKEPADGSPVYEHCSNVYRNSNLRCKNIMFAATNGMHVAGVLLVGASSKIRVGEVGSQHNPKALRAMSLPSLQIELSWIRKVEQNFELI